MTESKTGSWNLIVEKIPLKGSFNMAVDEYLFRSLDEKPQTCLRFYQWEKPTVSLGYSQEMHKVINVGYCRQYGIDIVRRITGGKVVLHHKELTYSVCSSDIKTFTPRVADSYKIISQALMLGLKKMGLNPCLAVDPPSAYARGDLPCFSYPARNEVEVEGKKIIGSAQKRIGSYFIQHGSVPIEEDAGLLSSISSLNNEEGRVRMISLSQVLGRKVSFEWAVEHLAAGFSEYFGVSLLPRVLSADEVKEIRRIQVQRYENEDWTVFRAKY